MFKLRRNVADVLILIVEQTEMETIYSILWRRPIVVEGLRMYEKDEL